MSKNSDTASEAMSSDDQPIIPEEIVRLDDSQEMVRTTSLICLDLDGVVHSYTSAFDTFNLPDPPVPGAFDFIKTMQAEGYTIVIHSARPTVGLKDLLRAWMRKHGLPEFNASKILISSRKPMAKLYIDDRGYRFTGKFPTVEEVARLANSPGCA